ncbi:MAG: UrcA family protein [Hyphomonadaceae bacterium]
MKRLLPLILAAAIAAPGAYVGSAAAQDSYVKQEDEIVVYPYGVRRERMGRGPLGARMQEISVSRVVTTDGLDLRYDGDVSALRARVRDTAFEACAIAEDMLNDLTLTSDRECVRDAVRGAEADIDAAVRRARYTY